MKVNLFRSSYLGPRFWRLWVATCASSLGDGMVLVAFPLLALTYTHNTVLISGVAVMGELPALLVGLPAGVVADRVNRRKMLIILEVCRLSLLAVFAGAVLAGWDDLVILYVVVALLGASTIAFDVAAQSSLPVLVDPDQLVTANAHLQAADITSEELLGQALGGVAFAAARSLPFLADAVSFVLSAGLIQRAIPDNPRSERAKSLWVDLKDGVHWFLNDPLMRLLTAVISSLAFCQGVAVGLLVLYGTVDLHLSRAGYGLMLGIASAGNLLGAAVSTRIQLRLGSAGTIALAGALAAISYPVLAATDSPFVAAAALAVEAVAIVLGNVTSRALRQSAVPMEMMGRVISASRLFILGSFPLGALLGGLAAEHVGVRHTMLIAGILQADALVLLAPRLISRMHEQTAEAELLEPLAQDG